MDFNNRKQLQQTAAQRLGSAPVARTIAFWFAAITTGVILLSTVVSFIAGMQISQLGGLGNLGARSVLSTIQSVLPLIASLFLTCLSLGFAGTMLRISRGQYASAQGMKIGFARFWPLLKVTLLQSALYLAATLLSFYLAFAIFLLTPLSNQAMELVAPLASQLHGLVGQRRQQEDGKGQVEAE